MATRMHGDTPTIDCFLCKRWFRFGHHIYEGRRVPEWDIFVCETCLAANHDGIVPDRRADITGHLRSRGVAYRLNDRGWLMWPASIGGG